MTVYRLTIGQSERFIRASSAVAARVRAFKVWKVRAARVDAIGQHAPDIGAKGYARACATPETRADSGAQLRAQQSHKGADPRAMYRPSEARQTRTDNAAREMLALFGLA